MATTSFNTDKAQDSEQAPIMVSILCHTYNHAPYIADLLESVVAQQTNFRFQLLIHDDASPDGTADIIREYAEKHPDIIVPILSEENLYSKRDGSWGRVFRPYEQGKYICICEGDDYFCDPLKLQRQVDYLEAHPDVNMTYTRVKRLNQETGEIEDVWGGPSETLVELLHGNTVPTPSVMYRESAFQNYRNDILSEKHSWRMGDYPLWLYFATTSKVHFDDTVTAVYRILKESASHSRVMKNYYDINMSYYDIGEYFASRYATQLGADYTDIPNGNRYRLFCLHAISLGDKKRVAEAKKFFKRHPDKAPTVLKFALKAPWLLRPLLRMYHRHRGWILND